jgi:hypothetical protein
MILTVAAGVAALVLLAGKELHAKAAALFAGYGRPEISWQQVAAAGLLVLRPWRFNSRDRRPRRARRPRSPCPLVRSTFAGSSRVRPVPRMPP